MNKRFYLWILSLLLISISCVLKITEKPDCISEFYCFVDGQKFEREYDDYFLSTCTSLSGGYGLETYTIRGTNCNAEGGEVRTVTIMVDDIKHAGVYPISFALVSINDSSGRSQVANNIIQGNVNFKVFTERFSDDYPYSHIQGSFSFSVYNEENSDTITVTDGFFCKEL